MENEIETTSLPKVADTSLDLSLLNKRIAADKPRIQAGMRHVTLLAVEKDRVKVSADGQETYIKIDDGIRAQIDRLMGE